MHKTFENKTMEDLIAEITTTMAVQALQIANYVYWIKSLENHDKDRFFSKN